MASVFKDSAQNGEKSVETFETGESQYDIDFKKAC